MSKRYFQSELAYLRDLGREFAAAHPSVAGLLSERGYDPDVERLLEGFAFLSAKIRERVEEGAPEVSLTLAELLAPPLVAPLPAATIVEFRPLARKRERSVIPAGVEIASRPIDGTRVRFRTTSRVDIVPLEIRDVEVQVGSRESSRLVIDFSMDPGAGAYVFHPDGIRLHFHGDLATSSLLYTWVLRHCRGITLRSNTRLEGIRLPADAIRAATFEPADALFPWPERTAPGLRHILEYFTLPEKLLFVDIRGLERAASAAGERFVLELDLVDAPPAPTRITRDHVRLHCAPAINLFPASATPLRVDAMSGEQRLTVADLPVDHAEIFGVSAVQGLRSGRNARREIKPFLAHGHGTGEPFFALTRRASVIDAGIDTFISLQAPRDTPPEEGQEVLSIDVLATNRSLAALLGPGDVSYPTPSSPSGVRFANISRVSKPARPPIDGELHWRLLAHILSGQRVVGDLAALRTMLSLYNFHRESDAQAARANDLRVESIRQVEARGVTRSIDRTPVRGWMSTLLVDETRLAGPGEAFLLGSVLDELFASQVTLNSFNELHVELGASRATYRWPLRCGDRRLA